MQRNFVASEDHYGVCKAVRGLQHWFITISYLYIELLMPFFLTDENITLPLTSQPNPTHSHSHNSKSWERSDRKWKKQGLHGIPRLEGQRRDPRSNGSPIAGLQMALLAQVCLVGVKRLVTGLRSTFCNCSEVSLCSFNGSWNGQEKFLNLNWFWVFFLFLQVILKFTGHYSCLEGVCFLFFLRFYFIFWVNSTCFIDWASQAL